MNDALELAIYRNLLGTFPCHCRRIVNGVVEEVSERNLGWNDAYSSLFSRLSAFQDFMRDLSEEDQTFLAPLISMGQVSLFYRKDGSVEIEADCSDLFLWGCSDSESFEISDVPALRAVFERDKCLDFWIAERRQMQPQAPIKEAMIESGLWTPEWEALPKNPVDGTNDEKGV